MRHSKDVAVFNIISYLFIVIIALLALVPFVLLVSSSMQSEPTILKFGFSLVPREISGEAYKYIFLYPDKIFRAYGVTLFITVAGTVVSLFLSSMASYVLYRKDVKYRNGLAFFLYFTTLFNGGLVPYYILMVRYLQLKDSLLALILPGMFNVMYILIIRSFMTSSVPDSLPESAKIDGANDFRIFISIVLPIMKPALASIGLFTALNYWNDWWSAMMFIDKESRMPLQYVLYTLLSKATFAAELISRAGGPINLSMPKESLKLAMTVVATGPIIFLYPFVQKYFVKGITLGAVKG